MVIKSSRYLLRFSVVLLQSITKCHGDLTDYGAVFHTYTLVMPYIMHNYINNKYKHIPTKNL